MRGLHIGCGSHMLPGWINADIEPRGEAVHLDATKPFPYGDGRFAHIFSEHMIEHIPLAGGRAMLSECFRVLASGGRVRISTPDLRKIVSLLDPKLGELERQYVIWSTRVYRLGNPPHPSAVVNNFMRAWGHVFVYDEPTLAAELHRAGFRDLATWPISESDDPAFRNLECVERMPPGFLALETMTFEATKP